MERWLKVLLGTFLGSIAAFVFYLIFERLLQNRRKKRERENETGNRANGFAMRVKVKLGAELAPEARKSEMERLVYEEFDSEAHEVLAISLETETTAVGICCFLSDREIEYYWETFPACCVQHIQGADHTQHTQRNMMAAVSLWAEKWTMAEAVNFLVPSGDLVRSVSKGDTRQWRAIDQYEKKHNFNFYIQWSDNFICGEVATEELWEEVVTAGKKLLNSCESEISSCWENFPVAHWRRKRVRLQGEHFHCVPHPGEVSPAVFETEVSVAEDLVEI